MNPLPETALIKPRPRTVLVLADLPRATREALTAGGAQLMEANTLLGTVALLADRDFDAAILDMDLSAEVVKRLKSGTGQIEEVPDELAAKARARAGATPFFLVVDDGAQFAVIVDLPEHSYIESGRGLSLADAVLRLDVAKLVMSGVAQA